MGCGFELLDVQVRESLLKMCGRKEERKQKEGRKTDADNDAADEDDAHWRCK